jgi:hypothetical protein
MSARVWSEAIADGLIGPCGAAAGPALGECVLMGENSAAGRVGRATGVFDEFEQKLRDTGTADRKPAKSRSRPELICRGSRASWDAYGGRRGSFLLGSSKNGRALACRDR